MIAIDFETYPITAEAPSPKPICLAYYDGNNSGLLVGKDMESYLQGILKGNDIIIAHNMRFESLVIFEWYLELRPLLLKAFDDKRLMCTKVYQQSINNTLKSNNKRASLADCVNYYFKVDISDSKSEDAWRNRYAELADTPINHWPREAIQYPIDDAIWCYKIYKAQQKVLPIINLHGSVYADFCLNYMGNQGALIDLQRVQLLEGELKAKIQPAYDILLKDGYAEYTKKGKIKKNLKLIRQYITDNCSTVQYTNKNVVSTSNESLAFYLSNNKQLEVVQALMNITEYEKILTSYIPSLYSSKGLIRSTYSPLISTGRTSSASTKLYPSVNIQQMPREIKDVTYDIRNCFIPRPGYQICSIDYSGLELCSTANQLYELTGQESMLRAINSGAEPIDMHSLLAVRLYNLKHKSTPITYGQFIQNKKKDPYKYYRQLAKPVNLGFPGGLGYDTMRTILATYDIYPKLEVIETARYENQIAWQVPKLRAEGFPVRIRRSKVDEYQLVYDELVEFKRALFNLYPDLEDFLTQGQKKYLTGQSKPTLNDFGEYELEPCYRLNIKNQFKADWRTYTQFCNAALMQAPSAIGAKAALCNTLRYQLDSNDDRIRCLAFIHDEIVFEIKQTSEMYAIIGKVAEIMIDSMQQILPNVRIAVEAEVFDYWKKSGGDWVKTYFKSPANKQLMSI